MQTTQGWPDKIKKEIHIINQKQKPVQKVGKTLQGILQKQDLVLLLVIEFYCTIESKRTLD